MQWRGGAGDAGDIEIEAKGVAIDYSVSVIVEPEDSGTATADPESGILGKEITLSASPNSGWQFKEWQVVSGDIDITESNTFTMPIGDVVVNAIFDKVPAATYTINVTGGEARVEGTKVNEAVAGAKVDLIASVPEGKVFEKWLIISGAPELVLADVNAAATNFTMLAEQVSLEAVFKAKPTDPTETDPTETETAKPTETTTPTPTETIKPTETTKPSDSDQNIPITGENTETYLWLSLLLFVVGWLLLVIRRKKLSKTKNLD
ncbi:MAG TPA: LPXTG cell wall anchor domain-containing protein [Clostridiaceae bacterium]|nr:LPXTG cell wall anchor domain-containing protein [Clostridiaceae bacterium]